jgi:hypothetical protein
MNEAKMAGKIYRLSVLFLLAAPLLTPAQDCKLKFAVVYNDGKTLQVGLTPEQKKMWDHDGPKKYKGMCLDAKEQNYVVLWSEGLNGAELAKAGLDRFNLARSTPSEGPSAVDTNSSLMSQTIRIRPSPMVRAKTDYFILDTSKTPYVVIRQGQGSQDVPLGSANQPGHNIRTSDLASTISDPTAALENALKWLKKEKKL